jgi:hypothetical protein
MNARLLQDLEFAVELIELRRLELTEEEVEGFVDLFVDNWGLENGKFEN